MGFEKLVLEDLRPHFEVEKRLGFLRPERPDFGSERPNLKYRRSYLWFERPDLGSSKA